MVKNPLCGREKQTKKQDSCEPVWIFRSSCTFPIVFPSPVHSHPIQSSLVFGGTAFFYLTHTKHHEHCRHHITCWEYDTVKGRLCPPVTELMLSGGVGSMRGQASVMECAECSDLGRRTSVPRTCGGDTQPRCLSGASHVH